MNREGSFRGRFGMVLAIAIAWAFVSGLILLQFWPHHPQTKYQWALFIAFAPPAYVLLEILADRLHSKRRSASSGSELGYGHSGYSQTMSFGRILAGVVIVLAMVVAFLGISWLIGSR